MHLFSACADLEERGLKRDAGRKGREFGVQLGFWGRSRRLRLRTFELACGSTADGWMQNEIRAWVFVMQFDDHMQDICAELGEQGRAA